MTPLARHGLSVATPVRIVLVAVQTGKPESITFPVKSDLGNDKERARLAKEVHLLLESTSEGVYGTDLTGHARTLM